LDAITLYDMFSYFVLCGVLQDWTHIRELAILLQQHLKIHFNMLCTLRFVLCGWCWVYVGCCCSVAAFLMKFIQLILYFSYDLDLCFVLWGLYFFGFSMEAASISPRPYNIALLGAGYTGYVWIAGLKLGAGYTGYVWIASLAWNKMGAKPCLVDFLHVSVLLKIIKFLNRSFSVTINTLMVMLRGNIVALWCSQLGCILYVGFFTCGPQRGWFITR